jgi:hypothetical protein
MVVEGAVGGRFSGRGGSGRRAEMKRENENSGFYAEVAELEKQGNER